jgi:protein ImuB
MLFAGQNHRPLITVSSSNAERLGVRTGQTLAEAKALLPKAVFLPADFAADRDALCQLALDCQRFTPLVGLEDGAHPESLFCEVTGCTHLWEGETQFLETVGDYWRKRGFQIQLALTSTLCLSCALAHTSKTSLIAEGDEEPALSGLSVAALRLPSVILESLESLGLWTIGDVLRLPRESLVSRFGAILPQRLGQALGIIPETFLCEPLKEPLSVFREWEVPVDDRNTLALLCRRMLEELLAMAWGQGLGIQELEGELRAETGPVSIEIRLVEPTRDDRHLIQLVELHLERRTWTGGIVAVRWTALKLGRSEQAQGTWFKDEARTSDGRAFNSLVERLSSRLDPSAVLRVEVVPDAQPEHAVRHIPWMNLQAAKSDSFTLAAEQSRARPFRLLGAPQPIDVASIIPDGPPLRMMWQRENFRVVRCWGPERIATGWWRAQDVERDYYRAEWEDGTHVWIYRDQRSGLWFLHGFFD